MSKPERSSTSSRKTQVGLRVLLPSEEISQGVARIAEQISRDYPDGDLLLVGVLKGAFVFLSDLARRMTVAVEIDFIRLESYGHNTDSTGQVRIVSDMSADVTDRDVLIVEDIIDTGYSVDFLTNLLLERGANTVRVCALLDKPSRRIVDVHPDYVGFTVPNVFVVGYGIDYAEQYRNLPDVCAIETDSN